MWPDGFPYDDYVRQTRRRLGLSQRALAQRVGATGTMVSRLEAKTRVPSVVVFERLIAQAGLVLLVAEQVDDQLRVVPPLSEFAGDCRDGGERRYPAHLPLVVDPLRGEWWGDIYGMVRPPETFYRDPTLRRVRRDLSRWETRHDGPYPRWPLALARAARRHPRGTQ